MYMYMHSVYEVLHTIMQSIASFLYVMACPEYHTRTRPLLLSSQTHCVLILCKCLALNSLPTIRNSHNKQNHVLKWY